MCSPESRSDEFIKNLSSAAIYFFKDGNLFLDLMADGGTMELDPAVPKTQQQMLPRSNWFTIKY